MNFTGQTRVFPEALVQNMVQKSQDHRIETGRFAPRIGILYKSGRECHMIKVCYPKPNKKR